MLMRGSVGVKPVNAITDVQPTDFSDIRQKSKVSINGTKADIRILLTNMHINSVGSGVVLSAHKECFDTFSLTTIL